MQAPSPTPLPIVNFWPLGCGFDQFPFWFPLLPPRNPITDAMPRLNTAQNLAEQLSAGKVFSVDVLCRLLVDPPYRNTMHATNPFMVDNAHILDYIMAVNPRTGQIVNSARLTVAGRALLESCKSNEAEWQAAKGAQAKLEADIEFQVKSSKKIKLVAEEELANLFNANYPILPIPPIIPQIDCASIVENIVNEIDTDPFTPYYRGRTFGPTVNGWNNRREPIFGPAQLKIMRQPMVFLLVCNLSTHSLQLWGIGLL